MRLRSDSGIVQIADMLAHRTKQLRSWKRLAATQQLEMCQNAKAAALQGLHMILYVLPMWMATIIARGSSARQASGRNSQWPL